MCCILLHLLFIALLLLCGFLRDLHLSPVKHMINIQNINMLYYRAINTEYMTFIQFIAAIESVCPAKHDIQSHYSSPDEKKK